MGAISQLGQAGSTIAGNAAANQQGASMANSGQYAPRASLLAPGVNPATGQVNAIKPTVSTAGTAPATFTGGRQGLEQAIAMQKQGQTQNALTSEIELRKAQTGEAQGRTASMGVNSMANIIRAQAAQNKANSTQSPVAKQQAALQKQQEAESQRNADTVEKLQKDVDAVWGAGSAQNFLQGAQQGVFNSGKIVGTGDSAQWQGDPNGPLVSVNPATTNYQGQLLAADAQPYANKATMQPYLDRFKKITTSPGGRYVQPTGGQPAQGQPPTQGGGSPPQVQSKQDPAYLALPVGAEFIDPDGVHRQKLSTSSVSPTSPGNPSSP